VFILCIVRRVARASSLSLSLFSAGGPRRRGGMPRRRDRCRSGWDAGAFVRLDLMLKIAAKPRRMTHCPPPPLDREGGRSRRGAQG
jgi:hypothetical protein